MKTLSRFLFALPIVASLVVTTSFRQGTGEKLDFYKTYDDYGKGKVTSSWPDYVEDHSRIKVTFGPHRNYDWAATVDGKQTKGTWKDLTDWGYKDSKGALYRLGSDDMYGA